MSDRSLAAAWQTARVEGRAALVAFFTAGVPTPAVAVDAWRRAADAGADVLEIGIPFSDPLADGPVIQRSSHAALAQGITAGRTLELVRDAALAVPVVLMTYANPVMAYGATRFAADARAAGVAGVLLTDVPAGTDAGLEDAVRSAQLDVIRLVAPTTTDARLASALADASGFVYLISRLGVTGVRDAIPDDLPLHVRRVRAATALPVAVGFGIGTAAQARAAARAADGVVVGSAIVAALERGGAAGSATLVGELARAVREARA